ncbi:zinc finger BED domain-containing protein RICESLEEPER 1-like [Impatiens glandulifera]|uniref:zinc finger BED domain-containing protein RICESLEEPER 1-like n=1 Tax=Impatiens glandulifera TaxID=253017 RepID=UPI001FB107ED|nr:zinc finger BED domain-containing protein RICESLEEPER 1-like [Impatiens glandulifera]
MERQDEVVVANSSRLKSVVWNDFDRVRRDDTYVAICRHCKKKLSGSSTSGTSHLRNHLIRCRRRTNHDISQLLTTKGKKNDGAMALISVPSGREQRNNDLLNIAQSTYEVEHAIDSASSIGYNFDNKRSRFDLAHMIILHGYPLAMVEHVEFKRFVRNLQPLFELVTVNSIEADCNEIYHKERQKVYEMLDKLGSKISISADMWSTKDSDYLSLIAHFIDYDWQLKRKLLDFIPVDPSHTEETLAENVMNSLMSWDIDRKLFSMTFDMDSTSNNVVNQIRERFCQNRFLLCEGHLFDIRCTANIIKLMVQDALEGLDDITRKIRESIHYVRSSQTTQEKFSELVQALGANSQKCLCIDNPLRWNSTYIMLEIAVEFKDVFSLLRESDSNYSMCPSDVEWGRAGVITGFLKLFVEVCNNFAGNKSPTANLYFPEICDVHLRLKEWCQNPDDCVSSLATKMKSKFDDYWKKCSLPMAIAAILDPRFKMKLVEFYYRQFYQGNASECISDVSNSIKALYNGHAICSPLDSHGPGLACQMGPNGVESRDRLIGFDKFLHETSQSQNLKSDLEKYLEEPLFPLNMDFNILNWWKVQTPRYPILSMMARNILGIPMSKVAQDFMFCTGERVLDHNRSSLRSDTLQALMCAQDWMQDELKDSRVINSIHSTLPINYDAN